MHIRFDVRAVRATKWYELLIRFLFGGAITLIAGLLAKHYGPVFGGLFLAFPAIFPATATLVEKHERQKAKKGPRKLRARLAAALCARGTELGSGGLICFAIAIWKISPRLNFAATLFVALAVWLVVSFAAWRLEKKHICSRPLKRT
jgi:uncharacterized membrane protein (GlpM family)